MWSGNDWIQLQALRKWVWWASLQFQNRILQVYFLLASLASSTFLKKGVDGGKQSNQYDREAPDSTRIFFSLLKSQSIPQFNSPPSCSPHLPESSCTSCWWGAGKLCGRECQNVLVELLYRTETLHLNWPPVSLDASRKSHSSQAIVPEDFPTIPPCKRFPRLLVTMMLRMFSKIFFAYNFKCYHICPKSTFIKHLCDSGLRLLQSNWS